MDNFRNFANAKQEDMLSSICRWIFTTWGWKIVGEIPNHIPKKLYVVLPHTSNWDFPVGILMKFAYHMEVGFIAKSSLFKWPYGWFFRMLGGIPVNRKKTQGFKDAVVDLIKSRDRFCTSIAPEGTRKLVKRLKTGFYYIARDAEIPIVYVKFDWKNKEVVYDKPKMASRNVGEELNYLNSWFEGTEGKIPEYSWGWPFQKETTV